MVTQTGPSLYLKWEGYYDYNEKSVEKYVLTDPVIPGVYKIASLHHYGRLTPIYIGKASNLFFSLKAHLDPKKQNLCLKKELKKRICCFKFAILFEEKERQGALKALCLHYQPLCNDLEEIPEAETFKINFQ